MLVFREIGVFFNINFHNFVVGLGGAIQDFEIFVSK